MLSNKLIDAAFNSLFANFGQTLRIGLGPIVLGICAFCVLNFPLITALLNHPGGRVSIGGGQLALLVLGVLALALSATYAAVKWHCVSLEVPDALQKNAKRVLPYFLMSLLLAIGLLILLIVVLLLPSSVFLGEVNIAIGDFTEAIARGWPFVALNAVATFVFAYLFLRLGTLPLVGYAIGGQGRGLKFWVKSLWKEILHTAFLYTVATFLWSLTGFVELPWFVSIPVYLFMLWIAFMLSIAILTEIYREAAARQMQRASAETGSD